ncbi:LysM repeat protein [Sinomonas atrocyanea]|jgi:LysM repeat protein|uniref:LysM peptidoglycan-binding domain-containing protein n=1 Tax=Sinomonas atrocyanea TaxID=37927 RepID=UPI0027889B9F|nr:LysM peptidoglycan-binding domain-containing protein [Sinomonas atrocyanea]MDP9883557.1 LysM repeat protein [Sinomonas atrocyanea]
MAHAIHLGTLPAPRTARAPRPALRLTRRGRIVLVVIPLFLATLALLVAWAALTAPAQAAAEPLTGPGGTVTVTVQPGESLWTIAARRVPNQDPRVTISQIQDLNGLTGVRVLPGEQILVPVLR